MIDNEIVRALRHCLDRSDCAACPIRANYDTCQIDKVAADLIERLQNEALKYKALSESLKKECSRLMTLNDELKVRLADTNARNERLSNDYSAYSGSALERADEYIEGLEAQLTASQARERAAVEDLTSMCESSGDACHLCKHLPCAEKQGRCIGWQWRGPQAGEVKQDG